MNAEQDGRDRDQARGGVRDRPFGAIRRQQKVETGKQWDRSEEDDPRGKGEASAERAVMQGDTDDGRASGPTGSAAGSWTDYGGNRTEVNRTFGGPIRDRP